MNTLTTTPRPVWSALQRYLLCIAFLMFLWEIAHLPLYTIWTEASWSRLIYAIAHCTLGDIVIALSTLVLAVLMTNRDWPQSINVRMVVALTLAGAGYAIYSEASNLARGAWAYNASMPTLPVLGTGITPLLQWLLLPPLALFFADRLFRSTPNLRSENNANVTLSMGEPQ